MNIKYILSIQGKILIIIALFMVTIFPWIVHFKEYQLLIPVMVSVLVPMLTGFVLILATRKSGKEFYLRETYLLVSLAWITMGIFGAMPYYLSGSIQSPVDSLFESISGFTTTGSSILTDVEALPRSILYWRSLTHWMGGMGIIVLAIAVLPNLNIAGYRLFSAEVSGGDPEKIKPRAKEIADRLWIIYFTLTAVLVVLLMIAGLDFFDSLCHSFATVATGGFSTKNASIGEFPAMVHYIIMLFMLLSGINFSLHYFALRGRFERISRDSELKAYLMIAFVAGIFVTLVLFLGNYSGLEGSIRDAFFQVISILTATGFSTADYLKWDTIAWFVILLLMLVGASVGSTGGGIKVIRHVVLFKMIRRSFLQIMHPQMVRKIRVNSGTVDENHAEMIVMFILCYLLIVVISTFFMLAGGLNVQTSLGSVLATIGGIGPGIGDVGPAGNFSQIPDAGKIYLSFIMILGRLEIFTLLVLFTPAFWRR